MPKSLRPRNNGVRPSSHQYHVLRHPPRQISIRWWLLRTLLLRLLYTPCAAEQWTIGVPWPAPPLAVKHSLMEGLFLPQAAPPVRQRLPPLPDVIEDLQKTWCTPLSAEVPIYGFAMLEMEGMENGWDRMPPVELFLANHLAPSSSSMALALAPPKLPRRSDRLLTAAVQVFSTIEVCCRLLLRLFGDARGGDVGCSKRWKTHRWDMG